MQINFASFHTHPSTPIHMHANTNSHIHAHSTRHTCVSCACSQRRASALQWNPEVATQLVVASDDDRSPTLQMWDLRNSVSPLKEFVGHSKVCQQLNRTLLLVSVRTPARTYLCWPPACVTTQ